MSVKVTVTLGEESAKRFDALMAKTEGTPDEVFRNALRLYEAMANEAEQGNIFLLKQPNGDIVPYEVF